VRDPISFKFRFQEFDQILLLFRRASHVTIIMTDKKKPLFEWSASKSSAPTNESIPPERRLTTGVFGNPLANFRDFAGFENGFSAWMNSKFQISPVKNEMLSAKASAA